MQAGQVGGGGGVGQPAGDFGQLAIQVARLDERTMATKDAVAALRSEMRTLIGGLYALVTIGVTVVGWLVTRTP